MNVPKKDRAYGMPPSIKKEERKKEKKKAVASLNHIHLPERDLIKGTDSVHVTPDQSTAAPECLAADTDTGDED